MKVFLPETLPQLWEMWETTPRARVYAGGTDLLVRLREGAVEAPALICLERIGALREIREEEDALFIGAAVPHADVLSHPLVRAQTPVLVQALRVLGSPLIRNMGTLGGNLSTASPAGDSLPALFVLDAEIVLASAEGTRVLPVGDFITGPGRTALERGEIIVGVRLPKGPGATVSHYEKVGRRKAMAIAVASLAARLWIGGDGVVERARLAWGSVGPTIVTVPRVASALTGHPLTRDVLTALSPLVREAVAPIDDLRASAAYRTEVAANLLLRLSLVSGEGEGG